MKLVYNPDGDQNNQNDQNTTAKEHPLQGHDLKAEAKNQREKMKDKPLKDKIVYYVGYYKYAALAVVIGVAVIFSLIKTAVNHKDYCFYAMIVNASLLNGTAMSEDFGQYAGLDTEKYECAIDTNSTETVNATGGDSDMATSTIFMAMLQSAELNCAVFDSINFGKNAKGECFIDLSEFLSAEDVERFNEYFYYIDMAEVRRINDSTDIEMPDYSLTGTFEEESADAEAHMDPSTMEDPVPVGIVISDSCLVKKTYAYHDNVPVFGIAANCSKPEETVKFLHYLFDETVPFEAFIQGL